MGGSGPHEGNIFVGGLPVCDDFHDHNNAVVVCRFHGAQNVFHKDSTVAIFYLFDIKTCPGCLGILMGYTLQILSLDLSLPPFRWTMWSALAMRHPSLTVLIQQLKIVDLVRELESNAPIQVKKVTISLEK